MSRRGLLLLGWLGLTACRRASAAGRDGAWRPVPVPDGSTLAQLHAGGPTGLLGLAADGRLWGLSLQQEPPRQLAQGLDPGTPLASGHGRIAARTVERGLWVSDVARGASQAGGDAELAPHAGMLILADAVLAVGADHRLRRFEAARDGRWREVARSKDDLLPDARPLLSDLDGRSGGGHIVVLAGPDAQRYRHGVLGDAVEATTVLWLHRERLDVLRSLEVPAPHVLEDIAPRPVALPGQGTAQGLLTVRSGPDGGQLALLTADPARASHLQLAALGEPVGGFHRWLAPTTDGRRVAAVHTPHIGGVLHVYMPEGSRLTRRRLSADVSTHRIGSRETDLAVWLAGHLLLPSQDGRALKVFTVDPDWAERETLSLPGRVVQALGLPEFSAWVGLLQDGRVAVVEPERSIAQNPRRS